MFPRLLQTAFGLGVALGAGAACGNGEENTEARAAPSPEPSASVAEPSASPSMPSTNPDAAGHGGTPQVPTVTPPGLAGGAPGTSGAGGLGGAAPVVASGGGGAAPAVGGSGGFGGNPMAGAAGSSAGVSASGGVAGQSGGGSFAGSAGSAGADAGPARFVCPEGPFPEPMVLSSEPVCEDFTFDYNWNEGPTWVQSEGAFFFTTFQIRTPTGGHIVKFVPGEGCEIFLPDVGCNGLTTGNDGNLLAACQQSRSVVHIDLASKAITPVADEYLGELFDTPNDLVQHENGTIYFTNPTFELGDRPEGVGPGLFRIDPAGEISLIAEGSCNGIALSPDQSRLYVLLLGTWDLDAEGVPSNQQELFTRGDGMAVDCAGNVYADGSIWSPDGETLGSWGDGTNLAFGGEDGTSLFVVGSGNVRLLTTNVPGPP